MFPRPSTRRDGCPSEGGLSGVPEKDALGHICSPWRCARINPTPKYCQRTRNVCLCSPAQTTRLDSTRYSSLNGVVVRTRAYIHTRAASSTQTHSLHLVPQGRPLHINRLHLATYLCHNDALQCYATVATRIGKATLHPTTSPSKDGNERQLESRHIKMKIQC